jgi:hypothetical protein
MGIRHRTVRRYDEYVEAKNSGKRVKRRTIPKPGKPWTRNNVDRILANEHYGMGWQIVNLSRKPRSKVKAGEEQEFTRVRYRLPSSPITQEQFSLAQEMRARRQKCSSRNAKRAYLLIGKLKCGICGASLYSANVKRKHFYYQCDNRGRRRIAEKLRIPKSDVSLDMCCKLPHIPQEALDGEVWKQIVWPYLSDPKKIRQLAESQLQENDMRPQLLEQLTRLKEQIDERLRRIDRIKQLAQDGLYRGKEAAEERAAVENDMAATKQHISKIEGEIAAYDLERESLDNLEKLIESYRRRFKLYWRRDHTDAQPTKRFRRKALEDFLGDGHVTVSVNKSGEIEAVAEPVFSVPVGEGSEATYRIRLVSSTE